MDWTQGYASSWRVDKVNPRTWEACGILDGIESIEIDRDGTDEYPLLESGTVNLQILLMTDSDPTIT